MFVDELKGMAWQGTQPNSLSRMGRSLPSTARKIAKRANRPEHEVRPILDKLGQEGCIFAGGEDEKRYFILRFLPGIFEFYTVMGPDDERKVSRIIPIQQGLFILF